MVDRSKAWFAAKRYGYGLSLPIRWQGWAATIVFIAMTMLAAMMLRGLTFFAALVVLIAGFCVLCARTTEGGWRWRQGEPD